MGLFKKIGGFVKKATKPIGKAAKFVGKKVALPVLSTGLTALNPLGGFARRPAGLSPTGFGNALGQTFTQSNFDNAVRTGADSFFGNNRREQEQQRKILYAVIGVVVAIAVFLGLRPKKKTRRRR